MEDPADDAPVLACADCGLTVEDPALQRAYLFAEDEVLCYSCATRRGGLYNELDDRWEKEPDMTGLFPSGDPEFGPRGVTT